MINIIDNATVGGMLMYVCMYVCMYGAYAQISKTKREEEII